MRSRRLLRPLRVHSGTGATDGGEDVDDDASSTDTTADGAPEDTDRPDAADAEDSAEDTPVDGGGDAPADTATDLVDSDAPADTASDTGTDTGDPDVPADAPRDTGDDFGDAIEDGPADTTDADAPAEDAPSDTPTEPGPSCETPGADPFLGCTFWTVDLPVYDDPTTETGGPAAPHGLRLTNPGTISASVVFESFDPEIATPSPVTVPPGSVIAVPFPRADTPVSSVSSRTFRAITNAPVYAVQSNPLELAGGDSGDSTLLLPQRSLGTRHRVLTTDAGPDFDFGGFEPQHAFATTVAVLPGTTAVVITPTADIADGPLGAWTAGEPRVFELAHGEAVNLSFVSDVGAIRNPSGTLIESDGPVAVFAGHEQATVGLDPDGAIACCADHTAEQLPPVTMWGATTVAAHSPSRGGEADHWIVVADTDGTRLTATPSVPGLAVALDAGEFVQVETTRSFVLDSTHPVLVGRAVVGQAAVGVTEGIGDPSLGIVGPVGAYGREAWVDVPAGFEQAWLSAVAPDGALVTVDGAPAPGTTVDIGAWTTHHVALSPGLHQIEASEPIGASVIGYDGFTSFEHIAPGTYR